MARPNNVVSMPVRPDGVHSRVLRDYTQHYVVPGSSSMRDQRILTGTEDDVEIEVNLRTYDLMENDSTIIKCKKILITGALADDMQLAPGATEEEVGPQEFEVYEIIMRFCERLADGLDRPYRESCEQLLGNGIRHGHGIGEIEWEYRTDGDDTAPENKESTTRSVSLWQRFGMWLSGEDGPQAAEPNPSVIKRPTLRSEQVRLMPKAIKVKPRGAALFVVDDYMNVLGLTPSIKHRNNIRWDEIVDRGKFLVLTLNKQDEDPRGKSSYRPAFNWYNLKSQFPAEMLRFILEELVPKVVAILPENAMPFEYDRDEDGNQLYEEDGTTPKMVTVVESFRKTIESFRGGAGAVLPHGTTFDPFKKGMTGSTDGALFKILIKIIDDQIENAILLQTLAQSEGDHQARSASQQVAELLYNLIFWIRWALAQVTLIDLFETAVRINFGDWAVRYLPQVSFGDFARRDWNEDLKTLADAYFKGFVDDSQRPELMAWMNMPRPGPSRQELGLENGAKTDVNGEPIPPNEKRPDKQPGTKDRNKGNGTEKKNATSTSAGFSIGDALGHHKRGTGFVSRNLFSGRKPR
jgi:hypothetical protein